MSFFLAVGVGLVAWPLLSYIHTSLFSQIAFDITSWHQGKGSVITPQLSTFIEHTLTLENITGLSLAVVSKHGEPEFRTWGYRTEDGDAVTPDTLFHMASVSKAFCGTALGLLIDDFANGNNVTVLPDGLNEFTWRTRLRDLLPDWELMDAWASERANLRDILSHVSGIPRHDASYGPEDTPQDILARLKHLRPAFELREQWSYNNIMYVVAAHVVETYAGQSYTSFVEERIFAPLGMTSSTFSPAKAESSGKFTQGWTKGGRRLPECFNEVMAITSAGPGGIISNAVDMVKWISAWINEGVFDNQTIFPASVYRNASYSYSVSTGHSIDPEFSIIGYGMGWFRNSYRGHDVVFHGGALPALSTLVSFLPSDGIGVTLFANGERNDWPLILIMKRIIDSALHLDTSTTAPSVPPPRVTTTSSGITNSTSSFFLDAFAGTYTNPGYGSLTLCSPFSTSSYCAQVQSDFATVDHAQGTSNPSGDLLAAWSRVCSTHVRMRHERGLIFGIYLTTLYPQGYGKDTTPFATGELDMDDGGAEFVMEDGRVVGFGWSGLVGRMAERERVHESVRDRADVWFDRV